MLKRHLTDENKENEREQPSSSNMLTSKNINTNEPTPSKKARMGDQEDTSKFQINQSEISSDEDDDEEEEKGPWPISSVIVNNTGKVHPTKKLYIIYENTEPNMISKTARVWACKYQKIIPHVNPDFYDMYIHNDFAGYGELEIIENCLLDIAKGIFLKHKTAMTFSNYINAFRRLEALIILLSCTDNFPGIDDGDRFFQMIRLIGACHITILRGLLPKSMFIKLDKDELNSDDMKILNKISQQIPNFSEVLKQALIVAHSYLSIGDICSAYTNILQIIYCNWLLIMKKTSIDLNAKPDKKDENLWEALKQAIKIKKNSHKESFNFMNELELYKENNPGVGGNSHDLRKWSKTRRQTYSFDNDDDDNEQDAMFWFRL